ncbi:putative rna recognition domain-containing protein [Golovinomyces cichoracearum]|uniref:Putative rna recognition domain-containing protein n=1 Tax=Golovinomyces cichoracearum TaxID=62708 RepID=A0A420HA86_9PEZI|nr:putative rna recognition domain-containing protein [Golovinomyces cichoracearum]
MAEESGRAFENISHDSKCFTPLIPPGFGLHQVNPSQQLREEQEAKFTSHVKPTSFSLIPRTEFSSAGFQLTQSTSPTGISRAPVNNNTEVTSTQEKKEIKSQKMISLKPNPPQSSQIVLQSEDFPALENGKSKDVSTPTASKSVPSASLTSVKKLPNLASVQTKQPKASSERRTTLNSDSSVPLKSSKPSVDVIDSSKKTAALPPLPSTLPLGSTPIANAQTPRNNPKTLRLTTTKLENVPNASIASSSVSSSLQPQISLSRHPSLTTNARLELPDTPTSEMVSDNASITSTSFSRASSPPPSRVGSAPVRTTTKSSQKKHRQAQKEKERGGIEAALKFEPEVEIAPIMGRKKKQKKERLHNSTSGHLSTSSLPHSPTPEIGHSAVDSSEVTKKSSTNEEKNSHEIKESIIDDAVTNVKKASETKVLEKEKMQAYSKSDSKVSGNLKAEDVNSVRPPPTPASIFQKLVSSGIIKDPNELYLLKNISSSYRHNDILEKSSRVEINPKLIITPEDHETLLAGKPVHKVSEAAHRIMLTPNGDCVRNLTEEEEKRYLEYQARLAKDAGPAAFVSSKHTGQNGFTMISGRAVPSGPPSYFPTPNKGNGLDAVSKIQRDEALNYINQYVLPTLSSNSQLDKAFNANSIQGDMMQTNGSADTNWKSWGPSDQVPTQAGIAMNDFYMSQSPTSDGMIENITTHFTIGEISRQQPGVISNTLNSVADGSSASLLSLPDAESAMQIARKESDSLEKKLNALIKKNRRLLLGAGH